VKKFLAIAFVLVVASVAVAGPILDGIRARRAARAGSCGSTSSQASSCGSQQLADGVFLSLSPDGSQVMTVYQPVPVAAQPTPGIFVPKQPAPFVPVADLGPNKEVAPHLPTPPCPNCQCGCTVTGSCTCKDCDHPQLTKPKAKVPTSADQGLVKADTPAGGVPVDTRNWILPDGKRFIGNPDGVRIFNGVWWTWSAAKGDWIQDAPQTVQWPLASYTSFSGGCSSGRCGR